MSGALCGDDQHAPDGSDNANDQEGFALQLPGAGNAPDRVDDFRQHQRQQNAVEQVHHARDITALDDLAAHLHDRGDQQAGGGNDQDLAGNHADVVLGVVQLAGTLKLGFGHGQYLRKRVCLTPWLAEIRHVQDS